MAFRVKPHTLSSLMAVRDNFGFLYISAGRYCPHLLLNDHEFLKAWPEVEWCLPDITVDPTLPTCLLPPLSGSSGPARGVDKRKHNYDVPIPEMG